MEHPKKSLGQHWLFDTDVLRDMVTAGEVSTRDTVLEVGPGLGTLTKHLCAAAGQVVAIEKDEVLAAGLKSRVSADNLKIINGDILEFDLNTLPPNFKTVANIPYYITANLLRKLCVSDNRPAVASLLVQKEVAQRVTASPGYMSTLAFSVQYFAEPKIMSVVTKELFEPAPKVDSAILQIKARPQPFFSADTKQLFRLVKAGFGERRKKLTNSLAGGLQLDKTETAKLLKAASLQSNSRAQELTLDDWHRLYKVAAERGIFKV